jgi:hypothetical protein
MLDSTSRNINTVFSNMCLLRAATSGHLRWPGIVELETACGVRADGFFGEPFHYPYADGIPG